jgi:hypothetical protein
MRQWQLHHIGIPTTEVKANEIYSSHYKFYSTPFGANPYRIQWHRYEPDSPLPEILKTVPHPAFKVDHLEKEIENKKILIPPYYPIPGFRAAIIEEDGAVIEFVETDLDDETLAYLESQVK